MSSAPRQHRVRFDAETTPRKRSYDQVIGTESKPEPAPPPIYLTWRTEPERSFSDWKIVVITKISDDYPAVKKTYHVHKSTLAAESEYFRTLFENDRTGAFAESKTATSTIELVAEGADAFPDFLDYMYRPSEPKLTTENATAIHHFGEYFQMKRLRLLANKFWKEDFAEIPLWSSFAISTCYKHAGVFNNAEIMTAVKNKCCEYCVFPVLATIAIIVPDPQLWLYLLRMGKGTEIFSLIIGKYCKWHDVEADLLTQLTDEKFLPTIHFDAAIILAETERMLMKDAMAAANLSSLQLRCINALANGWDRVDTRGTAFCTFLSHQSHAFVSELHKASLESARKSREAARAHPLRSDND